MTLNTVQPNIPPGSVRIFSEICQMNNLPLKGYGEIENYSHPIKLFETSAVNTSLRFSLIEIQKIDVLTLKMVQSNIPPSLVTISLEIGQMNDLPRKDLV